MMEININLLSQKKQNRLKRVMFFLFAKNILSWFLIAISLSGIILIWGWVVLIEEFKNLSENTLSINREYSHYNTEIKELNKIIKEFEKTHANYSKTTPKILELANNLPDDILLNSLSLDKKNKKIEITGIAKTRNSLLNYQEKLKKIEWINEVYIPTKNLLKKEDIVFSFETTIK